MPVKSIGTSRSWAASSRLPAMQQAHATAITPARCTTAAAMAGEDRSPVKSAPNSVSTEWSNSQACRGICAAGATAAGTGATLADPPASRMITGPAVAATTDTAPAASRPASVFHDSRRVPIRIAETTISGRAPTYTVIWSAIASQHSSAPASQGRYRRSPSRSIASQVSSSRT